MFHKKIYLDSGATTVVDPKVLEKMLPYFTNKYGNASSLHSFGHEAKDTLEEARNTIANSINARPDEIIFTSGGTESGNFAIKGIAFANKDKGNHIITTKIEHKCILNACAWLEETQGFKITYLNVDDEGFVKPKELEKAITKQTILVSIMHANNEVGTIQDLIALGKVCQKHKVYFHTDACQSYTKVPIDVRKMNVDLVSINSHKINGPKGVGALFIKKGTRITPLLHGGEHEFRKRAGTENVSGVVGFAEAVKIANQSKHVKHMTQLQDKLIVGILQIEGTRLNGPLGDKRLCNNVNISFSGIEGEAVGGGLDTYGICSSTGSACSEASLEPSHVLTAMGLKPEISNGSLRLSLSRFNTEEEIDRVLEILPKITKKLRKISPFGRMMDFVLKENN